VSTKLDQAQDAVWIAEVLEHGLLRGSFVPPPPIRELRDLTRYRKAVIEDGYELIVHDNGPERIERFTTLAEMSLANTSSCRLGARKDGAMGIRPVR
jgi:DNA-binding GntR family transcriptional regulator